MNTRLVAPGRITRIGWALALALAAAQAQTNPGALTAAKAAAVAAPPLVWRGTNSWLTFGLDRVPGLDLTVFDIPLWQYVASLVYVFLAFHLSKFADWFITARLKRWTERTQTTLDDVLVEMLHGPIKVVCFVVLLHIGLTIIRWPVSFERWISRGLQVLVAVSLTYMALKVVAAALDLWKPQVFGADERYFREQLLPIVRNFLRVFVVVVSVMLTCQNLGLDITSLIASLSIGGLAIGLAAQDTLANFFGAIAVFLDKPFQVGDRIRLDAVDGTVETIGLRSTRVRNLDGHLVTIPNKTMGNATITNISRRPHIKSELNFGLVYSTSPAKIRRAAALLQEIYQSHPKTSDLIVGLNKFADSSLNIQVTHCWNGSDHKEYVAGMQELHIQVKERFDQEGIEMAFPTQTIYLAGAAAGPGENK